jgi:cytochrome P450
MFEEAAAVAEGWDRATPDGGVVDANSPLAPPASWPTPDNRRASRARRALYEEVDELIAHRREAAVLEGRGPTLDDAPALERTTMAIKEAMRLYPPAYALGRLAESEHEIGGYSIPAGSYVVVSQFATHRHPQFWDDAEAFDPARFTPERERARHSHAYFPFGGGPRVCIGSHFAMLEAVVAVVVLQRFQIRSHQATVPLDTEGITLRPKGAVPIQLAAR